MKRDIIVIGGTSSSVPELGSLLRALPRSLPAAVLATIQIPPDQPSILPELLESEIALPVLCPEDHEKLVPGKAYVSSPNLHLQVEKGRVRVYRSPEENLHRPAIDPLFRSAAYYYGSRVVGVLLSKSDSDGTSGLYAIKERKGVTVLRDPAEAHMPVMPWSPDRHVRIDYQVLLAEIPSLLVRLAEGKRVLSNGGGRSHAV